MDKFDDDYELDEFDEFDDADDDELFEKESQAEDFEERMSRETEAYLKGAETGYGDSLAGLPEYPDDDDDEITDEDREQFEMGYYDGYDEDEDLDE